MEAVCLLSVYCLAPCLSTLSGPLSSLHQVLHPLPLFHGSCTAPHFRACPHVCPSQGCSCILSLAPSHLLTGFVAGGLLVLGPTLPSIISWWNSGSHS